MVELKADISLSGTEFASVPYFDGIFYGNGYTISGMYLDGIGSQLGLFRYIGVLGEVYDLNVKGYIVPAGSKTEIGGIAGVNYGMIHNCTFKGTIYGEDTIGGIVGLNTLYGQIINCGSDAIVVATNNAGGIVGRAYYAYLRYNDNFGDVISSSNYVGGIAGIAINTNFVDVNITASKSSDVIKGANIVGGFAGLNVVNDPSVEYYNLNSSVSVLASFQSGQTDTCAKFTSGKEYVQQTLSATLKPFETSFEQGFGTAGAVFGFITSNPNNYRVIDSKTGKETIKARTFEREIEKTVKYDAR